MCLAVSWNLHQVGIQQNQAFTICFILKLAEDAQHGGPGDIKVNGSYHLGPHVTVNKGGLRFREHGPTSSQSSLDQRTSAPSSQKIPVALTLWTKTSRSSWWRWQRHQMWWRQPMLRDFQKSCWSWCRVCQSVRRHLPNIWKLRDLHFQGNPSMYTYIWFDFSSKGSILPPLPTCWTFFPMGIILQKWQSIWQNCLTGANFILLYMASLNMCTVQYCKTENARRRREVGEGGPHNGG